MTKTTITWPTIEEIADIIDPPVRDLMSMKGEAIPRDDDTLAKARAIMVLFEGPPSGTILGMP